MNSKYFFGENLTFAGCSNIMVSLRTGFLTFFLPGLGLHQEHTGLEEQDVVAFPPGTRVAALRPLHCANRREGALFVDLVRYNTVSSVMSFPECAIRAHADHHTARILIMIACWHYQARNKLCQIFDSFRLVEANQTVRTEYR